MNKDNLRPVSNIRHGDRPGTLRIRHENQRQIMLHYLHQLNQECFAAQ